MTTHTPQPDTLPTPPATAKNEKGPIFSRLLIGGVAVAIVLIAVITVALIQVLPQAFGSLANLYNTLHSAQNDRTLTVSESTTTVRSGDAMSLSWATTTPAGVYTFSYDCTDKPLAVEIQKDDGLRNIRCDTVYSLGETGSIEITARTEQADPVTLSYTVGFLRTNDTSPRASHTGEITITNGLATTPATPSSTETTPETTNEEPAIETPLARIETPQLPRLDTTIVTSYPTSDPQGRTDLAVRFIAVGTQTGNLFSPRVTLLTERQNALRFEVLNHGTKTSRNWKYSVRLPDGSTYHSPSQSPLKPNERTTITIGFPMNDDTKTVTTSVSIAVPGDATPINDRFVQTLRVSRY